MKTLKFYTPLANLIIQNKKHTTWRLFDEKDLQPGDPIEFVNKDTLEVFGIGEIQTLALRTLGTLTESDWDGHEQFASEEEMYETYRSYYSKHVDADTTVKIITFSFTPVVSTKG